MFLPCTRNGGSATIDLIEGEDRAARAKSHLSHRGNSNRRDRHARYVWRLCLAVAEDAAAGDVSNRHDRASAGRRSCARVHHYRLGARVRDLREARQLPRQPVGRARGVAPEARDRGGDADDLRRRAHVHVPDPQRLRVLAAGERRRDGAEHEVHLRADAEPRAWPRRPSSSSGTSSARRQYNNGQAPEITGIVAQGDTLTIHLIQPQGEFLTLLAMPFTCAVPTTLPPVEQFAPIPSAGPYYISAYAINQHIIASRNPNYHGPRPQRFDSLEYDFNLNEETAYQQVLSGDLDAGPASGGRGRRRSPICTARTAPPRRAGSSSSSRSRSTASAYMPLNTERPLVREPEHAQGGELRGRPHGLR